MDEKERFDKTFDRVKQVVAEVFSSNESELTLETKFVDDLGAESLDIITLLMEFEDAFDKRIPEEDAEKLVTVGDAVKYITTMTDEPSQA
jgi:acyl carrier protein